MKISLPSFEDDLDHQLVTRISLAGCAITALYCFYTIPAGFVEYSIYNIVTSVICLASYLTSRKKKYTFTFWMFFLALPTLMFVYTYRFGLINAHLYLISGLVMASFMVKRKKLWNEIVWLYGGLLFIGSLVVLYLEGRYGQMSDLESLLFFPNAAASLLMVFLATNYFRNRQEKHRDELNESMEFKDRLLGIISHDLRSPVHALRGLMVMMEEENLPQDEVEKIMKMIRNEVDSSSTMLDNLLYWTKGQMDGLVIRKEPLFITDLLEENLRFFSNSIERKSIVIKQDIAVDQVTTDREMFTTIIRNILSNSIKYCSPQNGRIEVTSRMVDKRVELTFTDNGIGVDQRTLKKIFDGGKSNRGTMNEKGYGIGLPLIKMFSDDLKVEVNMKSIVGTGTICKLLFSKKDSKQTSSK